MRKTTTSFVHISQKKDGFAQFSHFLEAYPLSSLEIEKVSWRYRLCGEGSETILLLPGAPGLGFTSFPDIQFFTQDFRLLVPDYPAQAETLTQLVEGLASLITTLDIKQISLIGGSYGGLVAQTFVQHYPEKVAKLVLSHSTIPRKRRAILFHMLAMLLKIFPSPLISLLTQAALPWYMRTFPGRQDLWYPCFKQVLKTLQKKDYLARLRVHADFDRRNNDTTQSTWSGRTLLIVSDNDPYTTVYEQKILQDLYPQATLHTFQQTSHYVWATDPQTYFSLIKTFLHS